jgi:hypothetical protein
VHLPDAAERNGAVDPITDACVLHSWRPLVLLLGLPYPGGYLSTPASVALHLRLATRIFYITAMRKPHDGTKHLSFLSHWINRLN